MCDAPIAKLQKYLLDNIDECENTLDNLSFVIDCDCPERLDSYVEFLNTKLQTYKDVLAFLKYVDE